MNRETPKSPVSEGTVRQLLEEDYISDDFVSDVENIESDDNSSDIFADDTDVDPDYVPEDSFDQPGPSHTVLGNPRLTLSRFTRPPVSSSSDDEADPRPSPTPPQSRPRGRPRKRPRNVPTDQSSSESDSEDGSGWVDVDEINDQGFQKPFAFGEVPGIKHAPPRNSSPMTYWQLFFT
ncbi:hypothetical protein J6590_107893, partial [Homalodisca vitripennis]